MLVRVDLVFESTPECFASGLGLFLSGERSHPSGMSGDPSSCSSLFGSHGEAGAWGEAGTARRNLEGWLTAERIR
ncbi:MAG: hypothetical protein QG671_1769 [Actinomycetota bacterium]|nr:hypothetical protein [Actinomycetota bacterium]